MISALVFLLVVLLAFDARGESAPAQGDARHDHAMQMDAGGMVMNENRDRLPRDCAKISEDIALTVRAGRKHAQRLPGTMFAFDRQAWSAPPCARITVTFVNDDDVRHQWMVHGLPRYLYPMGMFHLEVAGRGQRTGTFIVPSAAKTYLVHCDVSQHAEKGMKAQLEVGGGDGDLPSIPGISSPILEDPYPLRLGLATAAVALAAGLAGAVLAFSVFRPPR